MHPTVKPVAMVADAMRDCSKRGGIVLDAFSGSGMTIMAAEQAGRAARTIELDSRYVDVAIRRWQKHSSKQAVLVGSGVTFDAIEQVVMELAD
jgi:DNA modification methylase